MPDLRRKFLDDTDGGLFALYALALSLLPLLALGGRERLYPLGFLRRGLFLDCGLWLARGGLLLKTTHERNHSHEPNT